MWFRSIIAGLACSLLALPAGAEDQPYRVSLIGDAFDGTSWHTGVLVELAPGWKTYWRMPGEAGIPPEFNWTTSAPADVTVAFPGPRRYADQSGETVGYEEEALFPVTVTAARPGEVTLGLELFFAVCKDICIPARASASTVLGAMMRDPQGSARVEQALARVPGPGTAVQAARLVTEGEKTMLVLDFAERPDDVFVEAAGTSYFRAPEIANDGRTARLVVDNLKDPARLSGARLTLTYWLNGKSFQQAVTLP